MGASVITDINLVPITKLLICYRQRRGAVVRSRLLTGVFDALTRRSSDHQWNCASKPRQFIFQVHDAVWPAPGLVDTRLS
jgi:hypothetical protein